MAIFKDFISSCKGTYICRNHVEKADEIIGQATPPLFHDFEGLELVRRELSKKFDSIISQGDDIFPVCDSECNFSTSTLFLSPGAILFYEKL